MVLCFSIYERYDPVPYLMSFTIGHNDSHTSFVLYVEVQYEPTVYCKYFRHITQKTSVTVPGRLVTVDVRGNETFSSLCLKAEISILYGVVLCTEWYGRNQFVSIWSLVATGTKSRRARLADEIPLFW